ncbi:MAG: aldo/keto reductase, partial [Acidobacteriales bacterium]
MQRGSSRRKFIATSLAVPAAGLTASRMPPAPALPALAAAAPLSYGVLGKTGLKVTRVGFGCMITSDPSVIARALDMGINLFDTARTYQRGNNERMVGEALKASRDKIILSTKSPAKTGALALADLDASLRTIGTD